MEHNRKSRNIPFAYVTLAHNKSLSNQWGIDGLVKSGIKIKGKPCGKKNWIYSSHHTGKIPNGVEM